MLPERQKNKLAIIGFASNTRGQAPYHDLSWDVWGCNQLWTAPDMQRFTGWVDLHPRSVINSGRWNANHLPWLQALKPETPVFMQRKFVDIPASVEYPREEIVAAFQVPYFTSSIAWMLALGIYQGYDTIGLWGVDMLGDSEYAYQRSCCEWLIGMAMGRGIEVQIPASSALLKGQGLYGYEEPPRMAGFAMTKVNVREQQLKERHSNTLAALHRVDGALYELGQVLEMTPAQLTEREGKLKEMHAQQQMTLYALDGALQELEYWKAQAKHMERGGA